MASIEASKFTFTVEGTERRRRLDDVVCERLCLLLKESAAQISRTKVRRMISEGTVSINGRPVYTTTLSVKPEDRISVFLDRERFLREKKPDDIKLELSKNQILFEDDWIVILDKPAGIPTESTIVASRDSLHAALLRFLSARHAPGRAASETPPYAGLHHRLDRETSGVILFARNPDANAPLHAAFEHHEVIKIYEALCSSPSGGTNPAGRASPEFTVSNMMGRVSAKSARAQWGELKSGGQRAETAFRILAQYPSGTHMQAMPRTGRTHQIRVHLAGLGMPILGDSLYGGRTELGAHKIGRVMLHAMSLELRHPINGKRLCVKSPLPADFMECLERLGETKR